MKTKRDKEGLALTPGQQKARRRRNIAMAIAIGLLVMISYEFGPGVLNRRL